LDHKTEVEELIIKKSGIKYHYTHIFHMYFENVALNRRFQGRCMLRLLHLQRKGSTISKKDRTGIYGCTASAAAAKNKVYHSIT